MFDNVYLDPVTKVEETKARHIIQSLYEYYSNRLEPYNDKCDVSQLITDYISGMSDSYAIRRYQDLFIPKPLAESTSDEVLYRKIRDEVHQV
jgi:dGTPase